MVTIRKLQRSFQIGLAILVALSPIRVSIGFADDGEMNLPPMLVWIEVTDGTESYFNTELNGIPPGYDVLNGTYPGWCVDVRTEMARSPATHPVFLYSSTNPPGDLANEEWDMVNYILNHKQGTAEDIQQAVWYFIHMDGNYTPTNPVAWTIIDDALENGDGFIPVYGQTIAVICLPMTVFPGAPDVQISIIEVTYTIIPEFPHVLVLPLTMLATGLTTIILKKKLTNR